MNKIIEKIKFSDDSMFYEASVYRYDSLCEIIFVDSVPSDLDYSKFKLFNSDKNTYGIFDEYKTLYRTLENGFILSSDGSVYVEPDESTEPETETPIIGGWG